MIANTWRKASLIAVLVSVVSLIPGASRAAVPPFIFSVDVFGHQRPEVNEPASHTLFANSAPFGPGLTPTGLAWARGEATPGAWVTVVATDVFGATSSATTKAELAVVNGFPNPDSGRFLVSVRVTDLGTHAATGADPNSNNPADWGGSFLTFDVQARAGGPTPGAVTDVETRTLKKYPATPFDKYSPLYDNRRSSGHANPLFPTGFWCHGSGTMGQPTFTPEAFLAGCGGWNPNQASLNSGANPTQAISGGVTDELGTQFGIYSEIKDITITISGGALTTPRVVHSIGRDGGGAGYGFVIFIHEFEPTVQRFPFVTLRLYPTPYSVSVSVVDAWNNTPLTAGPSTFDVCTC